MLRWWPWLVAGALLGASAIGDLAFAPWSLGAAAAFVGTGLLGNRGEQRWTVAPLVHLGLGAALNATLLWAFIHNDHRPTPSAEFEALELRAHELLADVPLHDVWSARLAGADTGLTAMEVRWLLVDGFRHNRNTAFVAVASIRGLLGLALGWDEDDCYDPAASFVHRLTEADRSRSLTPPGDSMFVYTFRREAMMEIINCTVHALIAIALDRGKEGHRVYWAFYVKPVGWITRFYMALIQPFRLTVVYPSIIERVERDWKKRLQSCATVG
jgi:hypothetical protein